MNSGLPTGNSVTALLSDANHKYLWLALPNAIYRSDNQGTSWQGMNNGLPANAGIHVLAQGVANGGQPGPILVGTDHGLFLSSDAGQHWAQSQSSLAALQIFGILPDITQPAQIYVTTTIGVLQTQNNGQSWTTLGSGLPDKLTLGNLVQGDTGFARIFVASHSGVYRYPGGDSGSIDFSRILPIILIVLLFAFLYRFLYVRRRRVQRSEEKNS
jgi:ligand-binding sensor domain-containing protein